MRPRAPAVGADIEGTLIRRDDPGYEDARTGAVWNEVTPPRCPELIVRAATEADVVHAVTWARAQGLRVSMRSGGHNWSADASGHICSQSPRKSVLTSRTFCRMSGTGFL